MKWEFSFFSCHIYTELGVYIHTAFYKPWANITGSFSENLTNLEICSLGFDFWVITLRNN